MACCRRFCWLVLVCVIAALSVSAGAEARDKIVVPARSRILTGEGPRVLLNRWEWKADETAIIICDMWNKHWCEGATRRVAELAPVINKVVGIARDQGVFIIHAPSGTMQAYKGHPARKRAIEAPTASDVPGDIGKWRHWIDDEEQRQGYPVDHSDGGCDCEPKCRQYSAWERQIDSIEIQDGDAISDSGVEIWNLLAARGVRNVVLMGVHTNMCVLGRPFGLRNMARYGKNVVLMRDMTDTMYNSKAEPFVSHFTGTDLIVEHIERYVCPTVTSTVFTGKPQFVFENDKRPRAVIISAEREYKAALSMPVFADQLQRRYGFHCDIVQGNAGDDEIDRNYIAGMEELAQADLAVVFVRRRAFAADQMKYLRHYLDKGGPLIGLRTASHAFDTRGKVSNGHADWRKFDPEVLGGNYHGHYGSGVETTVTAAVGASKHPILKEVELPFTSVASLYKAKPLEDSATELLRGSIPGAEPEPVAWTHSYGKSRVFYTSLGHLKDFENRQFRRMLINAAFWAIGQDAPKQK